MISITARLKFQKSWLQAECHLRTTLMYVTGCKYPSRYSNWRAFKETPGNSLKDTVMSRVKSESIIYQTPFNVDST
jgi:hypothetical protein